MKAMVFLVVFLLACAGLLWLAAHDSGVQMPALMAPSDNSALAATYDARSTENAGQAAYIRTGDANRQLTQSAYAAQQAEATRSARAALTQAAIEQTAAVQATGTQMVLEATLEAGRAAGTSTARVQATVDAAAAVALLNAQTAAAINLQSTMSEATVQSKNKDIDMQVRQKTAYLPTLAWYAVITAALAAGAYSLYQILKIKQKTAVTIIPRHPNGASNAAYVDNKFFDPDKAVMSVTDLRQPATQPQYQDQVDHTNRITQVNAVRALVGAKQPRAAMEGAQRMVGQRGQPVPVPTTGGTLEPGGDLPKQVPWDLAGWNRQAFPLGVGPGMRGILMDPKDTPNLIVAGKTHSGKTMRLLRPLASAALVSNCQVVVLNEKAGDYEPLKGHPNLYTMTYDRPRAEVVAEMLAALQCEVERRDTLLRNLGVSTYYRLYDAEQRIGPKLMFIVDEIVALINNAPAGLGDQMWSSTTDIASRCRAMGIMLILATTDPTYRTLGKRGLTTRDNCGRVCFRVNNEGSSRAMFDTPGAERLDGNRFMVQLDGPIITGVAFHPMDDEVKGFLDRNPVQALPEPEWLPDTIQRTTSNQSINQAPLPAQPVITEPDAETQQIISAIREAYVNGSSKRGMALMCGFEYAGNNCPKIDRAIDWMEAHGIHRANGANGAYPANSANGEAGQTGTFAG